MLGQHENLCNLCNLWTNLQLDCHVPQHGLGSMKFVWFVVDLTPNHTLSPKPA